ncbi:MAG TPA: beta-galactosidase family protein [Ktedonosporobacter sp.]|nr:beta-galactosidase family protein [Ktedonosporobacter sp.]
MGNFTIKNDQFLLNGQPFRILSGAMHYFRIPFEYWDDRLYKLRAMGLNTVETYVAWNLHEPEPGTFRFDGNLDLADYIRRAAAYGLQVIVRPGPYICAEWEAGGLPAWLLKDPAMRLRCYHQPYLQAVDRFFDALLPQLVPLQISQGGPIIAMQVENEYGSYGNDKAYLQHLADGLKARGIDSLLFTSDGPTDEMLQYGTLPAILKTANFGSHANEAFTKLREYQPKGPLMCMEYWNGWFDHWGDKHNVRDPAESAQALDEILAAGASVNIYMFHGGTNFGFTSGANLKENHYEPTVTSYDYDAPLNEAGDLTPKYHAYREVLSRYTSLPDLALPEPSPKQALGQVALPESVALFDALEMLAIPAQYATAEPMEYFDQSSGFIHYRTRVTGPREETPLTLRGLHDRALVFGDGQLLGVLERAVPDQSLPLAIGPAGITLDIFVEAMGRVNYGPEMLDRKGITGGVVLGQQYLYDWTIFPLPLNNLANLVFSTKREETGPAFHRGSFNVTTLRDTFLALPGWSKGVCWINGFNLGRYWNKGPQQTLYVPAPVLRPGENELVVFELETSGPGLVEFRDQPNLGDPRGV